MNLKRRIFVRNAGLVVAIVAMICCLLAFTDLWKERRDCQRTGKERVTYLARECRTLLAWKDLNGIHTMLANTAKDGMASYAWLEQNGQILVHTFPAGVPRGLLSLHPTRPTVPSVRKWRNKAGETFYDSAVAVPSYDAVVHLGIAQSVPDAISRREIAEIVLLGALAILLGMGLSYGMSALVTQEIATATAEQRDSEHKYRILFESSRDAMMTIEPPSWKFAAGNQSMLEMFRLKDVRELTTLGPWDISPERQPDGRDSGEKAREMIATAMREGSHFFEWTHKRIDGEEFSATVLLARMEQAGRVFLQATVRDITEQKQAEAKRQEALERLQKIAGRVPGLVYQYRLRPDGSACLPFASEAIREIFRVSPEEVREDDTNLIANLHPDDRDGVFASIQQSARDLTPWQYEFRVKYDDGTVRPLYGNAVPQREEDGSVLWHGFITDITERKQAEAVLRESETRMRAITDSAQDAILMIDSKGRVSYWNPAAERIFGYTNAEAIGQNLHQFIAPQRYHASHHEAFPEFQLTGRGSAVGRTLDLEARRKDGQEISVQLSLSAIQIHGDWHAVGILRDITERKLAENNLLQAKAELQQYAEALESSNKTLEEFTQLAESATRAKSEFLANMSHEIRTPMTAILGFAEILLGEPGIEHAPPERIEAVRTIQRNGQYLLKLINDILDLSKIEAGKLDVEHITCEPVHVLTEVISLMRVRANAKNLTLTLGYVGGIPETIQTDPIRLRQILINLVGNAIKFTETGSVRVVARLMQRLDMPTLLQVDVIDTGIGLTQEQVSMLFTPFHQADSSTTRRFGGTGLGLNISKRLAEKLGGDIAISSAHGKGSTFSVTVETGDLAGVRRLKMPDGMALAATPAAPETAAAGIQLDCRILLAEDGQDNQRLIAFLLRKAGAEVTLVENGQLAMEQAVVAWEQGQPFDVILMDMQMPVMDGYTATRQLRARGYTGPIVALTAHAMAEDRQECFNVGCDDFVTKPIDRQRLLATVVHWTAETRTNNGVPAISNRSASTSQAAVLDQRPFGK